MTYFINRKELEALQVIADNLLSHNDKMLAHLVNEGVLAEVENHE